MPAHRGPGADKVDPAVEAELDRLPTSPIAELRKRYRELLRTEPPKAFGPDLLRRSIAHTIQQKAYGGLPPATRRLLDQLVKAASVKPNGRLELPRRIKPGSELVRTWNGRTYHVAVVADGFVYGGKPRFVMSVLKDCLNRRSNVPDRRSGQHNNSSTSPKAGTSGSCGPGCCMVRPISRASERAVAIAPEAARARFAERDCEERGKDAA